MLGLVLASSACGGGDGAAGARTAGDEGDEGDGGGTTLTVLAASSLTDAGPRLARAWARDHPEVRLRFSFAGSQELAAQVRAGVPADVLVTADQQTMRDLGDAVGPAEVVATNRLVIVVAPDNPERIERLAGLARDDVVVVLAAPEVPAGRYAREALREAGVRVRPASEEPTVRAVLTRVRLGEADAGLVYATDASAGGDEVATVRLPADAAPVARYPAAAVANAPDPAQAAAFVRWLGSTAAREQLSASGFGAP
jgi:molybdate transport system substrate-binding protein